MRLRSVSCYSITRECLSDIESRQRWKSTRFQKRLEVMQLMRRIVGGKKYLFFFSSRRRHTNLVRDWSSDVCSSDLDNCVISTILCNSWGCLVSGGIANQLPSTSPICIYSITTYTNSLGIDIFI